MYGWKSTLSFLNPCLILPRLQVVSCEEIHWVCVLIIIWIEIYTTFLLFPAQSILIFSRWVVKKCIVFRVNVWVEMNTWSLSDPLSTLASELWRSALYLFVNVRMEIYTTFSLFPVQSHSHLKPVSCDEMDSVCGLTYGWKWTLLVHIPCLNHSQLSEVSCEEMHCVNVWVEIDTAFPRSLPDPFSTLECELIVKECIVFVHSILSFSE